MHKNLLPTVNLIMPEAVSGRKQTRAQTDDEVEDEQKQANNSQCDDSSAEEDETMS